jgi:plasmid stabilization system protein ParE
MSGYVLTPRAKADIFDIWAYIAGHNQDAADRVEQAIFDACAFLAQAPCAAIPALTLQPVRFVSGR